MSTASLPSDQLVSALRLAPFASQHHMSDYNKIKFGAQGIQLFTALCHPPCSLIHKHVGSPLRYLPVSLHMPSQFHALQERKALAEITQRWWPCDRTSSANEPPTIHTSVLAINVDHSMNVTQEILEAISSPLHTAPPHPLRIKTSASHPINISAMIPPEMIPILTSHLNRASGCPFIFDVHPRFTLDRIFQSPPAERPPPVPVIPAQRSFSSPLNSSLDTPQPGQEDTRLRRAQNVSQALEAALGCDISISPPVISKVPSPVPGLPNVRPRILHTQSSSAIPSPTHIQKLSVQVAVCVDPSLVNAARAKGQSATAPPSPKSVTPIETLSSMYVHCYNLPHGLGSSILCSARLGYH